MPDGPSSFPFPSLPAGQVKPDADLSPAAQVRTDTAIARWFIAKRWGRTFRPESPLGRMLAWYEAADWTAPLKPVEAIEAEERRHLHYLAHQVRMLAWAVRALHGNGGRIDVVAGSFIDHELLGEDSTQPDAERTIAGGIGTMAFAGRLVQAGGGRILSVNGKSGVGHDIRWLTASGDLVLVERKDRAFERGQADTQVQRISRVVGFTRGSKFRSDPGAAHVLVVGFPVLVRASELEAVNAAFEAVFAREFSGDAAPHLPHFVVVEHLGLEAKTGGEQAYSWVPLLVKHDERILTRVGPLLLRALGANEG